MEKFYVLGTSFRFHKKLDLHTVTVNMTIFFFFFFFFFFRLCAMYAFYHLYVCLSFRVNLMLCINDL